MILNFFLLLLMFQLCGDVVLQINKIKFKKEIRNLTLLEHFIFSLILGMILNTYFTVVVVFFIPFNLLILYFINLTFLIFGFLLNGKSFKDFFYWRLTKILQKEERIAKSREYYIRLLFFVILTIIADIFISSRFYQLEFQDLLTYAHYALDSIRNGWNIYDVGFIIGPYTIQLFTFLVIPFYSISPNNWLIMSGVYLSKLQFYLFFALIFIILFRYKSKVNPVIVPLIYISTLFFNSWFYYFLPSNFNLILILILIQFLFIKEIKSLFIGIIVIISIISFHLPSTLIMFGVPLVSTFIIFYRREKNTFINFLKFKKNINKIWRKISGFNKLILFGILILISITIIIILWPYFDWVWNNYLMLSLPDDKIKPIWLIWGDYTIGLYIILPILFLLGYHILKSKNLGDQKYILIFFFILSVYISILLSNFDFWRLIFRSSYPEYRFVIYLDFSLFLLIPIFLFTIKSQTLKYKKNRKILHNFKYRIQILKMTYIFIIIFIFSSFAYKVQENSVDNYKHKFFADYWPYGYYNTTLYLQTIDISNATYMFNPKGKVFTAGWNFFHTYLGDTRCIDLEQVTPYYNDSLYSVDNPKRLNEYEYFLEFVFNETKYIYHFQANYKNLPDYMRKTKVINYFFIDSWSNENLCNLLLNDSTHFQLLYKDIVAYHRVKNVFLFETII